MQSPIHSFISSLETNLFSIFPAATLSFDGQNLCFYYERVGGDFVHLVVDLTCMEEEERGRVAVHARPDYIFEDHWVLEDDDTRTLSLDTGQKFVGGDFLHSDEFEDGHGNTMWMFRFPEDGKRISDLVFGLAKISDQYFK